VGTTSASLDGAEALTHVLRASPVPVFTMVEEFVGGGVIGGRIWRFETDARRVATMARRLVEGASPRDIPIGRNTYDTILDWQQLQRWGIPDSRIPAGSIVLSRPRSFLDQYGGYVAGGIAVFTAQMTLIVGLLAQRARRRRAEEDARTHTARYQSVVDAQSDMICRFLPDTTLTFANDAYCRFWNKSREEMLGHPFIEMIPAAARPAVRDGIQRLRQGSDSQDHPVCLPDGTEGWHRWIHSAIVDQHGRVIEYQGVGRDITDQKRAETALRTAEQRNSAILRGIPDLMFVMRRDGTYVDYHARDPSDLFVPPDQFLGRTVREIMPPDLAEQIPWVHEACEALGVPIVNHAGFEADDVIGTLARCAAAEGYQVAIVTGDKDFFQLVDDRIRVFNPRDEGTWYDADGVRERQRRRPGMRDLRRGEPIDPENWDTSGVVVRLPAPDAAGELEIFTLTDLEPRHHYYVALRAADEAERVVRARPYSERPVRLAYELTGEGQELAGALRLLADWGSRVSREAEPLRHAVCGTPVEARWYCPTCERPVEGREAEEIRHV